MASDNRPKDEIIAERQANLPLPEDPPVASDWNSADARTVNSSAETKQAENVGLGAASESGLDREPASTDNVNLSKVGREAKDAV